MRLIIKIEDLEPKIYEVKKASLTIGRSSKNDIKVEGDEISRKHLRIRVDQGKFFVTDLDSANGSFINHERLPPNNETAWLTFLPIQLGCKVFVSLDGDEETSSQRMEATLELQKKNLNRVTERAVRDLQPVLKKKSEVKVAKEGRVISLMMVLILLGAGALIYSQLQTQKVVEKTLKETTKLKTPGPVKNQDLLRQVKTAMLRPVCQAQVESFYCLQLKLNSEKGEGAILLGDALYLLVDIKNKVLNIELDSDFFGFTDDQKRLYTMSSLLFKEELKPPLREANIQYVYLADIINQQLVHVLKVPVNTLLKVSSSDIVTIFGKLKEKDNSTFNRYLIPGMEMANAKERELRK